VGCQFTESRRCFLAFQHFYLRLIESFIYLNSVQYGSPIPRIPGVDYYDWGNDMHEILSRRFGSSKRFLGGWNEAETIFQWRIGSRYVYFGRSNFRYIKILQCCLILNIFICFLLESFCFRTRMSSTEKSRCCPKFLLYLLVQLTVSDFLDWYHEENDSI